MQCFVLVLFLISNLKYGSSTVSAPWSTNFYTPFWNDIMIQNANGFIQWIPFPLKIQTRTTVGHTYKKVLNSTVPVAVTATTNSTCVQSTQPPNTTTTTKPCKNTEVLNNCVNMICQYTNCSQIGQPIECVFSSTESCIEGCICKNGYLRADNGTCIPVKDCPKARKCPKANEYYELCPSVCNNGICGVNVTTANCSEAITVGDPRCFPPTCICKIGFYRNTDGECVVKSLCGSTSTSSSTQSAQTSSTEATSTLSNSTSPSSSTESAQSSTAESTTASTYK